MHVKKIDCCLVIMISLMILFAMPSISQAHKIKLFASAEGDTISGYVYFPGGGRAKNAKVQVFAPDGRLLVETKTDEKGNFNFQAKFRCDHKIVLDTGDGHRAVFVVGADELPETLPLLPTAGQAKVKETKKEKTNLENVKSPSSKKELNVSAQEVGRIVEKVVARHIRPLQEQIDSYESKVRLHDILGGIGYLFGLMGIVMYIRNRKKS